MALLYALLFTMALVCLAIAAFSGAARPLRVNVGWLGLTFWMLVLTIQAWQGV